MHSALVAPIPVMDVAQDKYTYALCESVDTCTVGYMKQNLRLEPQEAIKGLT